jgi:hypothetical protein
MNESQSATRTPKETTIFIDVPCPVSYRNAITGPNSVYKRLRAKGYNVILLVPDFAAEVIRTATGAQMEVITLPRHMMRLEKFSDFITKHLNLTRMQILGSKYGLRHNLDKKTRHGYMHLLRVIIAGTLGKSHFFRITVAPKLHLFAYKRRPAQAVFEKYKPAIVFLPNPGSNQGEEVLRECKRQRIPTVGMVGSWDHPHKRFHVLHTDTVFVWSDALLQEMVDLQSYEQLQIIVAGAPHFDLFKDLSFIEPRESYFKKMGLDPTKKLITLFSGTGRAPDEGDLVDMVATWNREGKTAEPVVMHVRAYPGDPDDHVKFDQFENTPDIFVDWVDKGKAFGKMPINYFPDEDYMKNVVSLYYHSTAVVSVYSSASVEASIFLKPSINIAFDGYKDRPFEESIKRFVYQSHFDKLFATGAVLDTHTPDEFLSAINRVLTEPDCNRANIIKLQETVCGPLDGKTTERMVAHIEARLQAIN